MYVFCAELINYTFFFVCRVSANVDFNFFVKKHSLTGSLIT